MNTESNPAGGLVRLSDATYRDRRAGDDGVGRAAASALLKVAEHVGPDAMVSIFPELAAATAAVGRLRDGELPEGFAEFDRVVVDEVQDLTLLETAVVVELCLAIAHRRGHAPLSVLEIDATRAAICRDSSHSSVRRLAPSIDPAVAPGLSRAAGPRGGSRFRCRSRFGRRGRCRDFLALPGTLRSRWPWPVYCLLPLSRIFSVLCYRRHQLDRPRFHSVVSEVRRLGRSCDIGPMQKPRVAVRQRVGSPFFSS